MKFLIIILILLMPFSTFAQGSIDINVIITQLNLKNSKCKLDLITYKINPNNPKESIVVIPEIVEESEQYFELNSHILIIDSNTGIIKQKYVETSKTNQWVSDAVRLVEISIDTTSYKVSKKGNAFGIKVRYVGSSHTNPFEKETISLFIKHKKKLIPILKNFTIKQYKGEWDTNCAGKFTDTNSDLEALEESTNNFFNIVVNSIISNSIAFVNKDINCVEKETLTNSTHVLRYKRGLYE